MVCGLSLGSMLTGVVSESGHAYAMSKDMGSVVTTSTYGLLAGTLAGLATSAISKDPKTIFVGSSVGLYLGIIVGIYHITHRYDPGNPLAKMTAPIKQCPQCSPEVPLVEAKWRLVEF